MNTIIRDRVGPVSWPENRHVPTYGMAPATDPNQPLMWTVNCVICHTAEIDGVAYFGAGTKIFDDLVLGEALKSLTSPAGRRLLTRSSAADDLAARANDILTRHHHDRIDSLTRARSTASPPRTSSSTCGRTADACRPTTKSAAATSRCRLCGIPPRRRRLDGGYADGSFRGQFPLMASSMELEKDRSFETLEKIVVPTIKEEFETVVRHPGRRAIRMRSIERWRLKAGRSSTPRKSAAHAVTASTTAAATSSGQAGTRTWEPTAAAWMSWNAAFVEAFRTSPPASHGRLIPSGRIRATPLTVWANYPYLHNGSVPTLHHLLGPASERPKIFNVMAARRFDRQRVGQPLYPDERSVWLDEAALIGRTANGGTGSTRTVRAATTQDTTSGGAFEPTRDGGRSSSISRRCDTLMRLTLQGCSDLLQERIEVDGLLHYGDAGEAVRWKGGAQDDRRAGEVPSERASARNSSPSFLGRQ